MRIRFWISCSIATVALAGCAGRSYLEEPDAGVDAGEGGRAEPPLTKSDKVDIVLVVDNTKNLEVAHDLFADTVPYLLDRLANPACVNGLGNVVATVAPGEPCPIGERDFRAVV